MELARNKKRLGALAIAVACAVCGFAAWIFEALASKSTVGLNTAVPWGPSIALFIVFIGLAAGCQMVAASSVLFRWKRLERVCGIAAAAGLAAALGGAFYIMADLGSVSNILGMLSGFNARSPLSWDMVALTLFMVIDAVFLALLKQGRSMRVVALLAIASSLFLLCVDSWIFAFLTSKEAWNSSLTLPWFAVSAASSGLALTVVLAAISGVSFAGDVKVCTAVAALAATDALIALSDTAIGLYHSAGADMHLSLELLTGSLSPLFWIEITASALAVALAVRARTSKVKALPVTSCALVLAAVVAKRLYFVASGFSSPHLAYPGAEGIASFAIEHAASTFSLTEALMAVGGVGILVAAFLAAMAVLPKGR